MGKQCVVIAVLLAVMEDGNAEILIRAGIATNQTCLRLNGLILYICEAFPESNCAGLIGEDAGRIRVSARYVGLTFQNGVAGHRVQNNRLGAGAALVVIESRNYLLRSISMRTQAVQRVYR